MNWRCLCSGHDWTCDSAQGISADDGISKDLEGDFFRYARMWCKRCRRYCEPRPSLPGSQHWDKNLKWRPEV